MNIFKKIGSGIFKGLKWEGKAQVDTLINIDRAVASEAGAPVDYTISGESNKHKALAPLKDVLNAIQPGHTEGAEAVDQLLTNTRQEYDETHESAT